MLTEKHHESIAGWNPQLRIMIESGGNFNDIELIIFNVPVFYMNFSFIKDHFTHGRNNYFAFGIRPKTFLNFGNKVNAGRISWICFRVRIFIF